MNSSPRYQKFSLKQLVDKFEMEMKSHMERTNILIGPSWTEK